MAATSETLLSTQVHPGDSTLISITGEKYKGDGYYGRSDGLHTVQYTYLNLIGTISFQATLEIEPIETDWFTVYTAEYDDETASKLTNFTGNYVWVRAQLTYIAGTLNSAVLNN